MITLNPYLCFAGNCEEAFLYYSKVFRKEFSIINRFADMPPQEDMPEIPDSEKNKIMHVSLPLNDDNLLMGSDILDISGQKVVAGNNFTISITVDSKEEADRLFNELSAGGNIHMPMGITFWGSYYGMFTDQFSIAWMISFAMPGQDQ